MPQTTYLPVYAASYPILAKAQKPGGVTVLATVGAGDVPNLLHRACGDLSIIGLVASSQLDVKRRRQSKIQCLADDIRRQKVKRGAREFAVDAGAQPPDVRRRGFVARLQ